MESEGGYLIPEVFYVKAPGYRAYLWRKLGRFLHSEKLENKGMIEYHFLQEIEKKLEEAKFARH